MQLPGKEGYGAVKPLVVGRHVVKSDVKPHQTKCFINCSCSYIKAIDSNAE